MFWNSGNSQKSCLLFQRENLGIDKYVNFSCDLFLEKCTMVYAGEMTNSFLHLSLLHLVAMYFIEYSISGIT